MRKSFVALLLLVGAAAFVTNLAFAQDENNGLNDPGAKLVNAKMVKELISSRAARPRTSADGDPDTVWFGHSATARGNWWNLFTGVNFPGVNDPNNAIWDWDNTTGLAAGDSLQGWYPIRRVYGITGGLTLTDDSRPWWAIDIGNQANYVIPQGAGGKRTFGVRGLWHRDRGSAVGSGITWSPIAGTASAWCGVRQHGDNSEVETVGMGGENNPFNQTTMEYNSEVVNTNATPTFKRFPGYTSQMDQMLYRDIRMATGQTLNVSFLYRTRMSTGADLTAATRTGWFHGDPRSLNTVTAGNFISSSAAPSGAGFSNGSAAPIDSFMVYLGAPVDSSACTYSDGAVEPVYDQQRRWFSEVIRINEPGVPYYELFAAFGNNPVDTASAAVPFSVLVPAAKINAILAAATSHTPGRVRLVFRVKTNRGFDDSGFIGTYSSNGRGAAMIDNVTIDKGAGAVVIGDFEGASGSGTNSIDNRINAPTELNWKSTGKPPTVYFHVRPIKEMVYNDLCGPPDSPARFCNISGNIVSAGNFDDLESGGDNRFLSDREGLHGMVSPTINLVTSGPANNMGVTPTIKDATEDYWVWYDLYAGAFNLFFTGNAWTFGAQSYPAIQPSNGASIWGELRVPGFQIFNPEAQCFSDIEPLGFYGLIAGNFTGYPDSLRLFLGKNQQCFRFAVSLGCNSTAGAYFDNVSLGFVDAPAAQGVSSVTASAGTISADIWQLINDTFPFNETPALPTSANFDTTSALIKTGINIAQSTSTAARFDIPGDTSAVVGSVSGLGPLRMDLVFRILPGPGNYNIAAGRHFPPNVHTGATNVLLQVPTNQGATVAPGDASFWGQYISTPGAFASPGAHFGGTSWDFLSWNSARLDTIEGNIFRVTGKVGAVAAGAWASMYHESDPHFSTLGISKNICYLIDTAGVTTSSNITCGAGTYPPAWIATVPPSRTGYPGTTLTKEYTKVIPDGLLTPGSHVQYFFRKCDTTSPTTFVACPDTNFITPQNTEGSVDGHRWQQFGVLPDRWKDAAFGGDGMACMLYVDLNDRRGNERQWVSVMDSIGGTSVPKWGAHNGWHARGDDVIQATNVGGNASIAVYNKNEQPGTTWDMYGVKASESITTSAGALGSRLATAPTGLAAGKGSKQGPTPEMLRTFYRMLAILSGDVNSGALGPFVNRSQSDIALLNDFFITAGGTARPRGVFIQGDGMAQSETQTGGVDPTHTQLLTDKFGLSLRDPSYQVVSGNLNDCADLITTTAITTNGDIYGVSNTCLFSNDLLNLNPGVPEATAANFYQNVGAVPPYIASVHKPGPPAAPVSRNWITLFDGFEIEHLFGRYCDSDNGRLSYYYNMLNKVFAAMACPLTGSALQTLDTPRANSGRIVDFMKPIANNPLKSGSAVVNFGLAKSDHVKVTVFDVTGRAIRQLADRTFQAGSHTLTWDGTADDGSAVARGVYFTRVSYQRSGFQSTGKLTILK